MKGGMDRQSTKRMDNLLHVDRFSNLPVPDSEEHRDRGNKGIYENLINEVNASREKSRPTIKLSNNQNFGISEEQLPCESSKSTISNSANLFVFGRPPNRTVTVDLRLADDPKEMMVGMEEYFFKQTQAM